MNQVMATSPWYKLPCESVLKGREILFSPRTYTPPSPPSFENALTIGLSEVTVVPIFFFEAYILTETSSERLYLFVIYCSGRYSLTGERTPLLRPFSTNQDDF